MYYITANEQSGDLVLKCTNSSTISVVNEQDPDGLFSASVTDGNKLNIHFDEVPEIENIAYSYLNVTAKVKNSTQSIAISITRHASE